MLLRMLRAAAIAGVLMVAFVSSSFAQLEANLGALTPDNVKGYLGPLPKALSMTLNSSEFQSAAIPIAGFNLTVGLQAMAVTFKSEDRLYTPTDPPGFTHTGSQVAAPTIIGDVNAVTQPGTGNTALYNPGGFDLDQFTIAVPQVAVGSVFGTRAVVRWADFDTGNNDIGKVSLFGIGVQHSLNRYLKSVVDLPFDVAAGAMYQTFSLGDDKLIDTKAFHGEITASKHFSPWLQPYAAIGYDTFSMEVNYDQNVNNTTQATNVKFDDENSFHATAGVLFGFPMFKLNAQLDTGTETGAAVGFSFGFGN